MNVETFGGPKFFYKNDKIVETNEIISWGASLPKIYLWAYRLSQHQFPIGLGLRDTRWFTWCTPPCSEWWCRTWWQGWSTLFPLKQELGGINQIGNNTSINKWDVITTLGIYFCRDNNFGKTCAAISVRVMDTKMVKAVQWNELHLIQVVFFSKKSIFT